jgi:hypothetical protein
MEINKGDCILDVEKDGVSSRKNYMPLITFNVHPKRQVESAS